MKTRGQATDRIVEMIDFYRTLGELAHVPDIPAYIQGESFADSLQNGELKGRTNAITQIDHGYTLRTSRYRFTRWVDEPTNNHELYDRLNDPAEMVNLANNPNYADIRAKLSLILDQRIKEVSIPVAGLKFVLPPSESRGYSLSEMLQRDPSSPEQSSFHPPPHN